MVLASMVPQNTASGPNKFAGPNTFAQGGFTLTVNGAGSVNNLQNGLFTLATNPSGTNAEYDLNPSDRTIYWMYDEFDDTAVSGFHGRYAWAEKTGGTGFTLTDGAGYDGTGSLHGAFAAAAHSVIVPVDQGTSFKPLLGALNAVTFEGSYSLSFSATDMRLFVGFDDSTAIPATNGFFLRYDPSSTGDGINDTTFHFVCHNASTTPVTNVDTTITPSAGGKYSYRIFSTTAGTIGMTLYDSGGSVLFNSNSVCTSTNVTSANLGMLFDMYEPNAVSSTFDFNRYSFWRKLSR